MTTDVNFRLDCQIKELRKTTVGAFWALVELLRAARRSKLWERMGYGSWSEYLAQPEISLKKQTVDNYITTFNRFEEVGLLAQVVEIPRSKALLIAPHITKENVEELTEKAHSLSWSDLRTEVLLLNGGKEPDETGRPPKPLFSWCNQHQRWSLTKFQLKQICIH